MTGRGNNEDSIAPHKCSLINHKMNIWFPTTHKIGKTEKRSENYKDIFSKRHVFMLKMTMKSIINIERLDLINFYNRLNQSTFSCSFVH